MPFAAERQTVRQTREQEMERIDKATRKRDAMRRVARVKEILMRWDPIGIMPSTPPFEYDGYATHIVSMAAQGCTIEELCTHLGAIRGEDISVEPDPSSDLQVAGEILGALRDKVV